MLAWWGFQFSREVKDSFSEEVTFHLSPERREEVRQAESWEGVSQAARGAGSEALWRGLLLPTREEQRRTRAVCAESRGQMREGKQPALTRRLSPAWGALPPAIGVWASAGKDGARAEVRPRSVLGLLHVLAKTLRNQHATQEAMTDLTFLDSKITANSDCGREIKRAYFLEGKLWQT